MPITELLGTITQHGQVHLTHDDRGTVCTDNSHTPKVITTVLGVVDDDGHEPLLAILHALDLHPDRLCRRCFGPWVRHPYARQWAARTNSSHVDLDAGLDALVVDTSVSAYVLDVTQAGRSSAGGFTVLVGGCTPHRFGEVANAAARATARRREWSGARLSAVAVRDDEALASFAYRPHDTMVELYRTDRPPSPFATAVNGHRAHRLGWENRRVRRAARGPAHRRRRHGDDHAGRRCPDRDRPDRREGPDLAGRRTRRDRRRTRQRDRNPLHDQVS